MRKQFVMVCADGKTLHCDTVIVVPETAIAEAGYIRMLSTNVGPQSKHGFHALAQMAFMQYEDHELDVTEVSGPMTVKGRHDACEIPSGMTICRTLSGDMAVLVHASQPQRKLLESAHRFCTRWIRLDVV
ncbi:MAG: hypothetical protein C4549_09000 [Deltaproteobacteria bacterium]|jgi:hypothetical protein|nr:MAG: hypothetical protein C4549_09000 [Deltaproteobacteria bacterium]